MAVYKDFRLTNRGIDLFTELLQGSGEMEFRYLAAGSGTYSESESSGDYIRGMGSLKEERQRVPFTSVKKMDGGMVSLKADLSNQGLTESYLMTEVGIYAGIAGSEESVLYCVTTPENPDYMPDFSSGRLYNVVFRTLVSIGDAEEVTVVYTPDKYVSEEELRDALKGKVDAEDGKGLSSNDYTDQDKDAVDGLNGLKFGQDAEGNWGYTEPGTEKVVPFGSGNSGSESPDPVVYTYTEETLDGRGGTTICTIDMTGWSSNRSYLEVLYTGYGNYKSMSTADNHADERVMMSTGRILMNSDNTRFMLTFFNTADNMVYSRIIKLNWAGGNKYNVIGMSCSRVPIENGEASTYVPEYCIPYQVIFHPQK